MTPSKAGKTGKDILDLAAALFELDDSTPSKGHCFDVLLFT